jgi:hypothetical protein
VLNDGQRVLAQTGVIGAIGMSHGGAGKQGGDRLAKFTAGKGLSPYINENLRARIESPIRFRSPGGLSYGYEATILVDLCDSILSARKDGSLQKQQQHIADQCEMLVRAFARVGIIALVDEATGYQYDRPRRELEEQLERFLSESLRKWVRTFPADYFKHLCRLRGVELRPDMRLPQYFGILTNNLIYRRIAPGLLKKLKERRVGLGRQSEKLHQGLSLDVGVPEVLVHLGTVVGLMKVHTDYNKFEKQLDQIAPIYPETPGLFDNAEDWKSENF